MSAAQSEIDDQARGRGVHATGGLGGDHGLKVDLVDNECFDDLRLDDRGGHLEHRLVGEKNPSFGNSGYIAGETEIGDIM